MTPDFLMRNHKLVFVLKLDSHNKMPVQAHSAILSQSSCIPPENETLPIVGFSYLLFRSIYVYFQ